MSDATDSGTRPPRRWGRYLALGALVPLGAAAAGALALAFPPRTIAPGHLMAMAAGAENTGGFALGSEATVYADTALYTGLVDAPAAPAGAAGPDRPAVYVVARVEDRWLLVSADPSVDCMDTTRLAVADSAGGLPKAYSGRLETLPQPLARRVVAALNRRTPDLTEDGHDGDRWSRRQLLPVMLASHGGVAHRARCLVKRTQVAGRDSLAPDSTRAAAATVAAPPPALPDRQDLLSIAFSRGPEATLGWLDGVHAANRLAPALREEHLNAAGYELLRAGRTAEAVAVLRWTLEHHPGSANAWDSLAEAYEADGDPHAALEHSRRALALLDLDRRISPELREQVRRAAAARVLRLP